MIQYGKITDFKDRIFRSFHKEAAELHDQVSYAFPWSRQWEYPWLLKNVSFNENDVIMDAGGGYCYFSCLLAKRAERVVVVDKTMANIRDCSGCNIEKECQDLNTIELKEKFDKIFCLSVLEHIEEYEQVILKLHHHLKENGYLCITFDVHFDNLAPLKFKEVSRFIQFLSINFELGHQDLSIDNIWRRDHIRHIPTIDIQHLQNGLGDLVPLGIIAKKK